MTKKTTTITSTWSTHLLAASFAIFISLDEHEKKLTRGKTRQWIKRRERLVTLVLSLEN